MNWNLSDVMTVGGVLLFAALIILLAEANDRWQRKGYMYGKDGRTECQCAHRGYEHSYRHGNCRFETIIGGLLFRCQCKGFREAWNTEELV